MHDTNHLFAILFSVEQSTSVSKFIHAWHLSSFRDYCALSQNNSDREERGRLHSADGRMTPIQCSCAGMPLQNLWLKLSWSRNPVPDPRRYLYSMFGVVEWINQSQVIRRNRLGSIEFRIYYVPCCLRTFSFRACTATWLPRKFEIPVRKKFVIVCDNFCGESNHRSRFRRKRKPNLSVIGTICLVQ